MVGEKLPKEMHYDINIRLCREEFDEMVEPLSHCLCQILVGHFGGNLFPMELDDE
jgi:hypothetical protein